MSVNVLGSSGMSATYRLPVERTDEGVSISIFSGRDGSFGLDDGVNSTDWTVVSSAVLIVFIQGHIPRLATSVAISKR